MYQEFYQGSNLLIWPLVGLGIFLLSFIGVLMYVSVFLRDKGKLNHLASLPLENDQAGSSLKEVCDNE
jgi:hypothetical protein